MASLNDVPPHDAGTWTDEAAREGELWEGGMFGVVLEGTEILLIELDGEVRATTTAAAPADALDRGWIEDGTLTCSGHMREFDVLSGKHPARLRTRLPSGQDRGRDDSGGRA